MTKIYLTCALTIVSAAAFAQFATPGNGSSFTFAQLAAIENSGVTTSGDKTYLLSSDLTITEGDKLSLGAGEHILFADGVTLTVNGEALFTPAAKAFIAPASQEARPRGMVLAGKANLRNLDIQGGGVMYSGSEPLLIEYCDFSNINSVLSGYGAVVLNCQATGNRIAHCTFTDCEPGAINTPANVGVELDIDSNTITNVSTLNAMRPYINITVCADRTVTVRNNVLNGAKLTAPGGIGVSNMLNTPGENKVVVENNTVTNCSWGLNFVGGMDVRIINNVVKDNCWDPDDNGGIGATLYSLASLPMTVYAERNTFEGNKWGPIVMGGTTANFGKTDDPSAPDYNPGKNVFIANKHTDANGNEVLCDFCNNTKTTVYAQGNRWNNATTEAEVAKTIMDSNYSSAYGPVIYTPFDGSIGIENVAVQCEVSFDGTALRTTAAAAIAVYDLAGNCVAKSAAPVESLSVSHLPKGSYIAVIGTRSLKFMK